MRYATLSNSQIHYAPNPIKVGSNYIGNPPNEVYIEAGYLPVIETEPPETDAQHCAEPRWTEENGQIVQTWTVEEIPISEEEALTRYVNELTGQNDPNIVSAAETLIKQRLED